MSITRNSLSITLRRKASEERHKIVAIVFTRGDLRHRTSLAEPRLARELLHPTLAMCVAQQIAKLAGPRAVRSDPTFILGMPGLVLACLRVMAVPSADGAQQVVITFRDVVGAFQNALQPGFGFEASTQSHRDAIEAALLTDVAQPVLDAIYALDHPSLPPEAHTQMNARFDQLARTRAELCFYLELLKRYVANGPARRAAPLPAATQPKAAIDAPLRLANTR